ncbi:autophagy-related protein 2 [[Candida] railenensis]|uniref:Autophagy-related protein 2 n=1 Tax=[Candida] railenensis TaxID=45579 RepID=A0A9P0QUC9_9ASCO|nr:autophagy-related protein 2 [[Candida] railenensis]
MPQWIPQNIQKRLLLYVLQQLSLFSEIDLPNLEEVSLNNISLRDVQIDPEKVGKLPGCNLRYGQVGQLDLNGGVMGGVNIDVSNVDLVVAPDFDAGTGPAGNGKDKNDNVQFSIAQSTADLANTIILEKDGTTDLINSEDDDESDSDDEEKSSSSKSSTTSSGPIKASALSGVMAKAVEIALSRLQVTIKNLSIKIVSELTDLRVEIDEISIKTINGSKKINILGIRIITLNPEVNPGLSSTPPKSQSNSNSNTSSGSTGNSDTTESVPTSDDEDGYGDESLMDSMVFTHEEASSIYMSATSQSFRRDGEEEKNKTESLKSIVLFIDEVYASFEGLSQISNLEVAVGELKVGAVPAFPTIMSILTSMTRNLKLKNYQKKKDNFNIRKNSKFPQYEADDSPPPQPLQGAPNLPANVNDPVHDEELDSNQLFNKLHIKHILVSLTSAILSNGDLASQDSNITVSLKNFHVKEKNSNLIYGGIETFSINEVKGGETVDVFKFVDDQQQSQENKSTPPPPSSVPKADFRFEYYVNSTETANKFKAEFTTLCSKHAIVNLTSTSLPILINFGNSASATFNHYNIFKNSLNAFNSIRSQYGGLNSLSPLRSEISSEDQKSGKTPDIIFQSSLITINLKLSDLTLRTVILPVSYKSDQNHMNIQKILLSCIDHNKEESLSSIANIRLYLKAKEFKSYVIRSSGRAHTSAGSSSATSGISDSASPSTSDNSSYPREIKLTSSLILAVPDVTVTSSFKLVRKIMAEFKTFSTCLTSLESEVNSIEKSFKTPNSSSASTPTSRHAKPLPAQPSLLQNSIYASQRRSRRIPDSKVSSSNLSSEPTRSLAGSVAFRAVVNSICFTITDLFPKFGSFSFKFDKLSIDQLRNGNLQGSVLSLTLQREFQGQIEKFIYEFTDDLVRKSSYPLIVFSLKKFDKSVICDISVWNVIIEYYTVWLRLVENEVHEQPPVEAVLDALPDHQNDNSNNSTGGSSSGSKKFEVKFTLHDCVIGLSPGRLSCKGYVTVEKGTADIIIGENQLFVKSSLRNISLLLIDDVKNLYSNEVAHTSSNVKKLPHGYNSPLSWFVELGCLKFGSINATHVGVTVNSNIDAIKARNIRLGIKDKLPLLELKVNSDEYSITLCADSAHTLLQMINDLKSPIIFSDEEKFKVELSKEVNLLDGIGDLFSTETEGDQNSNSASSLKGTFVTGGSNSPLLMVDEYIQNSANLNRSSLEMDMGGLSLSGSVKDVNSNLSSFDEDHFTLNKAKEKMHDEEIIPIISYVNVSKIHIYLYDGYDWKETRNAIKGAVKRVETQAVQELKSKKSKVKFEEPNKASNYSEDEELEVPLIGETLYQSIHLSIPVGTNPSKLTQNINKNVQNIEHEGNDESGTPSTIDHKNLRLKRSKLHKLAIEVKNLEVEVSIFTTRDPRTNKGIVDDSEFKKDFEIVNSISLNIENFQILDNVPTSTWHKFVGYLRTAGERELSTKALSLTLTNVRPNYSLCSTEAIINLSILPLRLYVDQDTLDFVTRIGEFKDSRFQLPIDDVLYIQRFKLGELRIKLDYKPKKVDYAGIRSGHTAEFINFFVIDGADIVLRSVTLYGMLGFPKLGNELKNVWTPDIQSTQLSGVLAGLAPIRSIVNIGTGVKDLVAIPVKEYKKDGRLIRSLQKGAFSFAKTTGSELLKFGVKLAAGTQVLLEQGEEAFGGEGSAARLPSNKSRASNDKGNSSELDDDDFDDDDEIEIDDDGIFYVERHPDDRNPLVYAITDRKFVENNLMASSQLLNQSMQIDNSHRNGLYGSSSRKLYSFAEMDDDSHTLDNHLLRSSLAKTKKSEKAKANSASGGSLGAKKKVAEDDESQRAISLYSNQPTGAQEGLQLAYGSIGRNLKSAKVAVLRTRDAMADAGSVPEAAVAMVKGAPVILIRPMIGATEAVSKTLLGLTNQIDPSSKAESEEKYKPL